MYVKKENIDEVLEKTQNNFEEYNVEGSLDILMMTFYKNSLDQMAKNNNYQEGKPISENDLANIKGTVNNIITSMASTLERNEPDLSEVDRIHFNAFDTLMAATDYLYALAMKKLGCPDIPSSFGPDVYLNIQKQAKELDTKVKTSYFNSEYSTKTYFDNQRRKDANVVRRNNKDRIREFDTKIGTPEELAVLVAEYQALKLRQAGHGRIWRFFHKQENIDRNELLDEMKAAIAKNVGDDVSLEPSDNTPANIAMLLNNKLIEKRAIEESTSENFAKRCNVHNAIVHDEKPINNPSNKEQDKSNVNSVDNEKRVLVNFANGEFNENDGVNISQAVSNESNNKEIQQEKVN